MDLENYCQQMDNILMDIFKKGRKLKEHTNGQMVKYMKEDGKIIKKMAKD